MLGLSQCKHEEFRCIDVCGERTEEVGVTEHPPVGRPVHGMHLGRKHMGDLVDESKGLVRLGSVFLGLIASFPFQAQLT